MRSRYTRTSKKDLSFGTFLGGAALFNESWPTELQDILSRWDASSDPGRRQVGLPDTYTDLTGLNCSLLTIVSFRDGCAETLALPRMFFIIGSLKVLLGSSSLAWQRCRPLAMKTYALKEKTRSRPPELPIPPHRASWEPWDRAWITGLTLRACTKTFLEQAEGDAARPQRRVSKGASSRHFRSDQKCVGSAPWWQIACMSASIARLPSGS